jgi:DNA-binding CsgD family transcriptional regulator
MGAVARIRSTPESLPVGIAVLAPDGTIRDANAAFKASLQHDGISAEADATSDYFRTCSVDQQRHLHDVVEGRSRLFSCLQADGRDKAPTLLVAVPRGPEHPTSLILLQVSMAALLPVDITGDRPAAASFTDEPTFGIDLIVRTIEQTMQSMAATRAPRPERIDKNTEAVAAERDAVAQLLQFLTPRQREILELVGIGKSNAEIATVLGISMNTAKLHVSAILRRLDLENRMQAVALGARMSDRRS